MVTRAVSSLATLTFLERWESRLASGTQGSQRPAASQGKKKSKQEIKRL